MKRKKEVVALSSIIVLVISLIIIITMVIIKLVEGNTFSGLTELFEQSISSSDDEYVPLEDKINLKYEDVKYYPYMDENNKWGYVDEELSIVIPAKFDKAFSFNEGVGLVEDIDGYGFINKDGSFIFDRKYLYAHDFSNGVAIVNDYDGKGSLAIDFDGNIVCKIKDKYSCEKFHEGMIAFNNGDEFGYIDKSGKVAIKSKYQFAEDFNNGVAIVSDKKGYSLINREGKIITNEKYEYIESLDNKFFLCYSKGNRIQIINNKGETINLPNNLEPIELSNEGIIVEDRKTYKYGLIDYNNEIVIKPQFEFMGSFYDGMTLAEVDLNSTDGHDIVPCVINSKGDIIKTFNNYNEYSVYGFYGGVSIIEKEDKLLINKNGDIINKIGDAYAKKYGKFIIVSEWFDKEEKTRIYSQEGDLIYSADYSMYLIDEMSINDDTKVLVLGGKGNDIVTINYAGKTI